MVKLTQYCMQICSIYWLLALIINFDTCKSITAIIIIIFICTSATTWTTFTSLIACHPIIGEVHSLAHTCNHTAMAVDCPVAYISPAHPPLFLSVSHAVDPYTIANDIPGWVNNHIIQHHSHVSIYQVYSCSCKLLSMYMYVGMD